jgi:acylglycerol lipase
MDENVVFLKSSPPVVELWTKTWVPNGRIIATLTFVHGIGEHIKRYEHMFEIFRNNGIKVTGFDQRGFGESGERSKSKGHCEGMQTLIEDVKIIDAYARVNGVPHFVMGHSMGGLTALYYVQKYSEGIKGIIASAPALKPGSDVLPNVLVKNILATLAGWFPKLVIPNLVNTATLCRDKKVVDTFKQDPLNFAYATMETLHDVLIYGKDLSRTGVKSHTIPTLFTHGTADKMTDFNCSKQFIEDCPSLDKEFVSFEGYFHELHNEPGDAKDRVIDLYISWIKNRI